MSRNVYDQHRAAFANVSAYVITDKQGNRIATIAFKFGNAVTAYVHVFGGEMKKGIAQGGGYDRQSAAVLAACDKIDRDAYGEKDWPAQYQAADAFKRLIDCGTSWDRQLQDAGYNVMQAV